VNEGATLRWDDTAKDWLPMQLGEQPPDPAAKPIDALMWSLGRWGFVARLLEEKGSPYFVVMIQKDGAMVARMVHRSLLTAQNMRAHAEEIIHNWIHAKMADRDREIDTRAVSEQAAGEWRSIWPKTTVILEGYQPARIPDLLGAEVRIPARDDRPEMRFVITKWEKDEGQPGAYKADRMERINPED
jgi:hypothetical protein